MIHRTRAGMLMLSAIACLFSGATPTPASEFGRNGFSGDPATNGGATCSVCHATGAPTPTITISGPDEVDAGSTHLYSVTISGGPAQTAGVDIAVGDGLGTLLPVDADLQAVAGELSHTLPKAFSGGSVTFSFRWTAPLHDATAMLYAAGNAADGMLDLLGDGVSTTVLPVTVRNGGPPPPPDPPPAPTAITVEQLTAGLSLPVAIAHAGDARLFVVERAGRIRVVNPDGSLEPTPFLDIRSRVDAGGNEMGLLGLAFHPDHASNGYFYVYYTRDPGPGLDRTRVSRFRVGADPSLADAGSELVLMEFTQPFSNHNGGDLHFGPDGLLYIASGDGGSGGDPQDNGQDDGVLLGKMLRIDVDAAPGPGNGTDCDISGHANYAVPPGNAYNDGNGGLGCDEIYISGLRNPWRFSFDRDTGDLWVADVGQNAREEITHVLAGAAGGLNFGWRCYEGNAAYNLTGCDGVYFFPIHDFAHAGGNCSVTGGHVYRGLAFPELRGRYLFTDFCNSSIRTISGYPQATVVDEVLPAGVVSTPSTFGEGVDGELYVASLNGGRLYRILGVEPNEPPAVAQPGAQAGYENDVVALRIMATDAEGDDMLFNASGLPPGLSIDSVSGLISGSLAAGSAGMYAVTVTVEDDDGGTDSVAFSWTVTGPPGGGDPVAFSAADLSGYAGSQDDPGSGPVVVEDGGSSVRLQGNRWQKLPFDYTVTPDTVLEFDFRSSTQGQIHAIGFDSDGAHSADRLFKVHGTQYWGIRDFDVYTGSGESQHFVIPVGAYYTGAMSWLFFVMDHDVASPTGESVFSNVRVYEGGGAGMLDFNVRRPGSYGGNQDDVDSGPVTVLDGGATVRLQGNRWQKVVVNYDVTPDTVLSFDFRSDVEGQIHAIGLDTDTSQSAERSFRVHGTQGWGVSDFNSYAGGGGIQHFDIPVGAYFTGTMPYLFFIMDHDVATPTGVSVFSNVELREE